MILSFQLIVCSYPGDAGRDGEDSKSVYIMAFETKPNYALVPLGLWAVTGL